MTKLVVTAVTLILSASFAGHSSAASNKVSQSMGQGLAQAMCANCHQVEPGKYDAPAHVGGPAFQSVADRPDITRAKLRRHLEQTHANALIPLSMPNPDLSGDELTKILDYLMSLHGKSAGDAPGGK